MDKIGFRQKLAERQEKVGSRLCVGLDPIEEKAPSGISFQGPLWRRYSNWMIDIVEVTAPYACMFKPQSAHYEAFGIDGRKILQSIVEYINVNYPDIPVFLDCKRGDIGRTQQRYREAHFTHDKVDGMNFSPYMGKDCMEHLVDSDNLGRAVVGLCYTSNPSAREVQDMVLENGDKYWEYIAKTILSWSEQLGVTENAGLVMAAAYENPKGSGQAYSGHLRRCREIVSNKLWFLIPGVGTQGGFIKETILASDVGHGSIAINASSSVIFAKAPGKGYAEASADEAKKLRDQMNEALAKML